MPTSTGIQRQINRTSGPRRNMNGAGMGGRFVAQRATNRVGVTTNRGNARVQLGSREQRRADIRSAFGVKG